MNVNLDTRLFYPPKNCTLHVLPEYLEAYQQAKGWKDFTNIVGDLTEESGIEEVSIDEFDRGLPMEVYNMNGVKVVNDLDDLSSGVYIVRQGNKTAKVIR